MPFPSPGDLPDPGIESTSPAWQAHSLLLSHQRSPSVCVGGTNTQGSLDVCRTYTGNLNGNLGQRKQGLSTSAQLTAAQNLPLGADWGSRKFPSSRGAPTIHSLSLVWLPCVFPELSISPEAFLGCPQQWDPSAPHSGALGPAHLFPLMSSHSCFASASSPFP